MNKTETVREEKSHETGRGKTESRRGGLARRVLVTTGVVAAIVLLLVFFWVAVDVFLLVFGGILLAVFLCGLRDWVSEYTPLSGGWSLAASAREAEPPL
jgi:hypothetical protein